MNFLLRPSQQSAAVDQPTLNVSDGDSGQISKSMTLEGLIAEDSFPRYCSADDSAIETDGTRADDVNIPGLRNDAPIVEKHMDVCEEEGWITIPNGSDCRLTEQKIYTRKRNSRRSILGCLVGTVMDVIAAWGLLPFDIRARSIFHKTMECRPLLTSKISHLMKKTKFPI